MITDSHCHLDFPELYQNLDEVIKRAYLNKVDNLLTICTTLDSFEKIRIITKKYKNVYGTFGIHPHETKNHINVNANYILEIINKYEKIIGIGETGLDFFYNHSDRNLQKKSFINHIEAASKLNIPIIVHTREAEQDTYEILKSEKKNCNLKVLIHCFTGSKEFSKKLIDLNCYISVSGIITFKNSNKLVETVSSIPIENLLVETDSPYLSPAPYRGKPNEPSYIVHTINKLSEIKKLSNEKIISYTTNNFNKLFNLI
jgi:TatD DNase family protein